MQRLPRVGRVGELARSHPSLSMALMVLVPLPVHVAICPIQDRLELLGQAAGLKGPDPPAFIEYDHTRARRRLGGGGARRGATAVTCHR
jgi:hypothetical protein